MHYDHLIDAAIKYRLACEERDDRRRELTLRGGAFKDSLLSDAAYVALLRDADLARESLQRAAQALPVGDDAEVLSNALCGVQWRAMGLRDDAPPPDLAAASLLDLVGSSNMVKIRSDRDSARARTEGKNTVTLRTTCDDRLIAATYAALHYEPGDAPEQILELEDRRLAVHPR